MWREEQTLWGVISPLCRGKNEKDKCLKRMSDKFQDFFRLIFSNKVLFQMRKLFFSLHQRFLNFSCFSISIKTTLTNGHAT